MKRCGILILSIFLTLSPLLQASPLPRWVFVHAMGMMPAVGNWQLNNCFPENEYAKSRKRSTWESFIPAYGGKNRMLPLGAFYTVTDRQGMWDLNHPILRPDQYETSIRPEYLKDRYRWDLEQAEEQGIDGFGLCLSGNEPSCQHAVNFFRALETILREKPSFRLRIVLIICGDELLQKEKNPKKFVWMQRFAKEFRTSPAWLRHDGKIVFLGYHSQMTWNGNEAVTQENAERAVRLHRKLFRELGLGEVIFCFDTTEYVPGQISPSRKHYDPALLGKIAGQIAASFPVCTCWGGVIPEKIYRTNYPLIAEAVRKAGGIWMMPIVDIHSGIGQFYRSQPGVERLLDTWKMAEQTRAGMVQLVTWNDWNEATSFAPSFSFNYALAALNARFIHRFKHGKFPENKKDEIFLFYRKYHRLAELQLYPRATVERDVDRWGENDDMLHVFVFAVQPGTLVLTGITDRQKEYPLKKGYNEFKLHTAVGKTISAEVRRNGKSAHRLVSPELVTDKPFREDLIPWGWSSLCRARYDRDFGRNFHPLSEYSETFHDGIPDWFRIWYFGTWDRVPGSGVHEDPDGDGLDNLAEYRAGRNPRVKEEKWYTPGFVWNGFGKALSRLTGNEFAKARINRNPFPDELGQLVYGFLYAEKDAVLNGKYPYLMKWSNLEKNFSWGFRSGRKHTFRQGPGENTVLAELEKQTYGILRFRAPADGEYSLTVTAKGCSEAELQIRTGKTLLRKETPGTEERTFVQNKIRLRRGEGLDLILRSEQKNEIALQVVVRLDR